ncbi:MAG: hypothetical protein RLZZ255_777 [Cyanobacteriota bacterium]
MDWRSAQWHSDASHFAQAHPIEGLLERWQQSNPRVPFQLYRRDLEAIAAASWQAGGARLLRNPVAMDGDVALTPELMAQLRQAAWVIPIDDDDWLSPHLPQALMQLPEARLALWEVLPLHVDADHCFAEAARTFLDPDRPLAEQVVLSCGYALSQALMADLNDDTLAACLLHHGAVTTLLADEGAAAVLPDVQSVLLRHPASAGSALEPQRERRLLAFPMPPELSERAPWALQPLQALQLQHQHAVALASVPVEAPPIPEPWVELPLGQPRLPLEQLQHLLESQGLNLALAQALVLDEAERAVQLSATESEELRQQQAQRWRDEHDGQDPGDARETAELEQRQRLLLRQARLHRFRELCFGDAVELRYLERKAELDRVVYSVIQVHYSGLAEELYQQIREGEAEFAELAAVHSLGREAQSRGQIGPEPLGDQHPELASRLRTGSPGQLWPPFEVNGLWVVLRLETASLSALDDGLRQRLLQELMDGWMEERTRQILAGEPLAPLPLPRGMEAAA